MTTILPMNAVMADLQSAINSAASGDAIVLSSNMIFSETVSIPSNVEVTLKSDAGSNWVLEQTTSMTRHFSVSGSSGGLILQDVTLDGGEIGGGIQLNGGSLTLNDGAVIQNCRAAYMAAAAQLSNSATVTVNDGALIQDNIFDIKGTNYGGAFNVDGNSTLVINGGTITGNKAFNGSVMRILKGTVTMNGGEISGNTATSGTIAVNSSGIFNMNGGKVSNNINSVVGAFDVSGGTLNMTGGTITENTVTSNAGGVYVQNGKFNMTGGTISKNKVSTGLGGGAYIVANAVFTMDGGTFSENIAADGGGVGVGKNGIFNFNGGEITDNTVRQDGGGIVLYTSATLNMNGGKISGNKANTTGGGICAYIDSVANINGGSILNNAATLNGGGIALYDKTTLNLKNSVVSGNEANSGGGIYLAEKVVVNITDSSSVINNTAKGNGGGIFAFKTHEHLSTSADTVFDGNKAATAYAPPENVLTLYPDIQFASTTIMEHPLNNYDINFAGASPATVNINYNANGGIGSYKGPDKQLFDTDTVLSLSDTGIVYEDYCFVSWNTKADGSGTEYIPGDVITLNSNVTLYAKWTFCGDSEPEKPECFDVESCNIDHCNNYKVHVPVTVKPYGKTNKTEIKVTCDGNYKVIPGHKDCESTGSHEFTIVQDIMVSMPVHFGAEICLGESCDEYTGSCPDKEK